MTADLHLHSTYSDGCLRPSQLVAAADALGLSAIALTDHDSIEGIDEAMAAGSRIGLTVIPGIELSCSEPDLGYHILGYRLDYKSEPLLAKLAWLKEQRAQRARRIIAKLESNSIYVCKERLDEIAGKGVIGRPHIATALVERGYADNQSEAFNLFLTDGMPGYVERCRLGVQAGINLIRAAGGIPVWAHPGKDFSLRRLQDLRQLGLQGVEVWHPDHSQAQMLWFADQAARAGLLVTGGSDFHCGGFCGEPALGDFLTPNWALLALQSF